MCGTARVSYTTRTRPARPGTPTSTPLGGWVELRADDQSPRAGSRNGPNAGSGPVGRAPTYSVPARAASASGGRRRTGAGVRSAARERRHLLLDPRRETIERLLERGDPLGEELVGHVAHVDA